MASKPLTSVLAGGCTMAAPASRPLSATGRQRASPHRRLPVPVPTLEADQPAFALIFNLISTSSLIKSSGFPG